MNGIRMTTAGVRGGAVALMMGCLMLMVSLPAARAGTNTASTKLTATITGGGTCTVSVNDTPLGTALPTAQAVKQNWPQLGKTNITVSLTNCAGLVLTGKAPSVTVTGTTLTGNTRLFRNATGMTSVGFGVAIYSNRTTAAGTAPQVASGVPVAVGAAGTVLNGDHPQAWLAAVSCGTTSECSSASLKGGTLRADVTFAFGYP